jgi:hypothetical protein
LRIIREDYLLAVQPHAMTGKVEGKTAKRHTSAEFVAFLAQLLSKTR